MSILYPKNKIPIQGLILLLVIAVLGGIYVRINWIKIEKEQSENVLQIARNIETFLPKVDIKALEERPGETDYPEYKVLKNALKEVVRINQKARFAYIYIERNGKIYFIADSEPEDSKDYSPPGQEYAEAKTEDKQPFRDGKELIEPSLPDRWGIWRSVLIPIKEVSTGKTIAIFGLDYDAKSWSNLIVYHVTESSVLAMLLLFVLLLFFIIKTKNKTLQNEIIERRKVENSVLMLAHAVRSISDCVSITDMKDNLLFVNNALLKTYQYEENELLGKSIEILRSLNNSPDIVEKILQSTLHGGWRGELLNRKKDGSEFPIFLSTSVLHDEKGEPVAFVGVATDITERKQDEAIQKKTELVLLKARKEAEMANKAKSVFLANMSHEIRTPLNAIIGFSQLMNRDKHLSDSQKEYINSIIRAGEHLLSLINDILELSKMEAGRLELNPMNVDLYLLAADIQIFFKEQLQAKHLQLILETDNDLPQYVLVDDNKLRRIFINLIGNAIKFTDEGGIAVRIRTDKINERKSRLIVEIQDSGSGIPEDELDKLFQHFVQTSSGINKSSGTGLGLALSRELAILMGGNISVTSEVGKGSVFSFDVEIEVGNGEAVPEIVKKRVIGIDEIQKNYRILVVDDNDVNLRVAVILLRMIGFETKEAVNGEDAIVKFEEWNPHLILMDMRMPVMDGYEATRLIKLTEKGKYLPIIALTASSFEDERRNIIALGMQGYIRKPFRESELFGTIGNVLGIKYIYETETNFDQGEFLTDDTEIVKDIEKLPNELYLQMQAAVSVADLDRLIELIKSIDPENLDLARHLMKLANNFDFDYLQRILNKNEE